MIVPNKNKNRQWSWRRFLAIGVFLLASVSAVLSGQRLFKDNDYLAVALSPFSGLFSQLPLIPPLLRGGLKGGSAQRAENQNQEASTPSNQEAGLHFDNEHYPIMVLIDNSPEARASHSGLAPAIIVYETLVEGGATRLAAVFAGPPLLDRLGPIRSIRPVFVDIASEFGAVLWHAGGSPEALSLTRNAPIIDLNEISYLGPRYFWRDYTRPRPHNLFTDGEKIKLALSYFTPAFSEDINQWQWGDVPSAASSSPAATIAIDFSPGVLFDAAYNYDAAAGNYSRFMAGRPHVDRQTNGQIATDNVIIQRVPAEGYYPSGYGRLIINTIGEGEALFFRDGSAFMGRWRKTDSASQTEWLTNGGAPFLLKPGNVWIEIVPGQRQVSYQ